MESWLRVLARCPVKPRGIIAYNSEDVRLEDFVSKHPGDAARLAEQLHRVVPSGVNTFNYEAALGVPFDDSMRDEDRPHLIAPEYVSASKRIILEQGKLKVV